MWIDSSFARWEVEGEAHQRIKNALREAEQRRLAKRARNAEKGPVFGSLLSSAVAGLQRLASGAEPEQRPAHP